MRLLSAAPLLFLGLAIANPACTAERRDVEQRPRATTSIASTPGVVAALRRFETFASVASGGELARDPRGYRLSVAPSALGGEVLAFAPATADGALHLEAARTPGAWIDVAPLDLAPRPGAAEERAVVYRDVAPDVDLVQVLAPDHVEELRLLRGPRASTVARYRVGLGPALTELRAREGHVEAVGASGYVHLATAPMFVVDSRGVRRSVAVQVGRDRDGWTFESSFDGAGLTYPIAVDPVWSPAATMASPRHNHAAVLMKNGFVLVAGGGDGKAVLSTAERYDVATNTWSSAGSFGEPRSEPTATLLESTGNVLLVGGNAAGIFARNSAALYDPVANTWAPGGAIGDGMVAHTATYIPSTDTVLVVGGSAATNLASNTSRAHLYDVKKNTWAPTAPTRAHLRGAAVLVGGASRPYSVIVSGGQSDLGVTGATDEYYPATRSWAVRGELDQPRMNHAAVRLGELDLLAIGGAANGSPVSTAERYAVPLNGWGPAGTTLPRIGPRAVQVTSQRILVVGGYGVGVALSSAELFDTLTRTWAPLTDMPHPRNAHAVVALGGGEALVIGGSITIPFATAIRYATPALGDACAGDGDCPFLPGCVDGVCCNKACDKACEACTAAKKGYGADGYCYVILAGTDPDNECPAKSCLIGTATETNKQVCNGAGACRIPGTTTCAPGYLCNSAGTACGTNCTSDSNCLPRYHCAAGACVLDAANGAACTNNSQCASGYCVDGVCCNTDCIGPCRACTAARKGSGANGTCDFIVADSDPDDECPRDGSFPTSCGRDGFCDGFGSCRLYAKSTVSCGATTCSSSPARVSGKLCNGLGSCVESATPLPCAPYACATDKTACATSCALDGDCTETAFCTSSKTCELKRPNGEACGAANECESNSCVDGVCCNTDCAAQCAACDIPGKVGTCVPVAGKPHGARAACAGDGTPCGGTCDGVTAFACYYPLSTTSCGSRCVDGKQTKDGCDGKGACVEVSSTKCGAYKCGDTSCREQCVANEDCANGYRCAANACIPAAPSQCIDEVTSKSGETVTACSPFRCEDGTCAKICQTSASCASGFICNSATKVCEPPAVAEDSGGCTMTTTHGQSFGSWSLVWLGVAAAVAARRRRDGARRD